MSRLATAAALALGVAGCGRSDAPRSTTGEAPAFIVGGSGKAEVELQPEVRVVPRAEGIAALRGVSSEGSTLLFDGSQSQIRQLQPGDVLMIEGLLARTVLAVDTVDGAIAVLSEPAQITDVVRDGTIKLEAPVRFGSRLASIAPSPWQRFASFAVPEAHAQSPDAEILKNAEAGGHADALKSLATDAVKGVFEGWETTFAAVPGKNRVDLTIELKKDVGGFRALITGSGYLSDFDVSSDIGVSGGMLDRMELVHRRLNGLVNFTWEVAKDSPGAETGDDRIKLPAAISIPLYQFLDGLPLFLEISSAMIIRPAISGGKQYSQGSFRVTFDGTQGFRAKEGTIDPDGQVKGRIEFVRSQNISALAPLGMVVAFAAPRVELTFGTSKLPLMSDMAEAAGKVDFIAEQLAKRVFGQEGLDRLKSSPMGGFKWKNAVENAVASDAVGFVEIVTTAGMTHTGFSVVTPCTRTELGMIVKVGASAQAFGQKLGEAKRDVFKHNAVRVDPPGTPLCENIQH